MIRHVVVLRWIDGASPEQVAGVTAALDELPARIPAIRRYEHGPDLGWGGTWDYAVVADFDDEAGWRAYMQDPDHDRVRQEILAPLAAERGNVQIALDLTPDGGAGSPRG